MADEGWIKDLKPEDLPEPYRAISEMIGMENTLKLADKFQGMAIYLPKLDAVLRKIRDERIKAEFNGANYRELARKYGLTEVWVRQLISSDRETGQITLMDFRLAASEK
jgi:Mor family transcriptional regulator